MGKGGDKGGRNGYRESRESNLEGGLETENCVVELGHSRAVASEDSLLLENLTQSNKGICGHVERATKEQEALTFSEGGKTHRGHSVGGFDHLRHSHVIKHQNGSHFKREMTS